MNTQEIVSYGCVVRAAWNLQRLPGDAQSAAGRRLTASGRERWGSGGLYCVLCSGIIMRCGNKITYTYATGENHVNNIWCRLYLFYGGAHWINEILCSCSFSQNPLLRSWIKRFLRNFAWLLCQHLVCASYQSEQLTTLLVIKNAFCDDSA